MAEKSVFVPVEVLRKFILEVHLKAGVSPEDAETCTRVIIESDIRGIESHGIGRLKYYFQRIKNGQHQKNALFEVVKDSPATAVVDGHNGLGMVIGTRSMQMAIDKARNVGIGCVVVRNSSHYGIAGYYPLMAVKEGMIGLSVTNARPSVSPTFGVKPMLGTNPIAFGAPSDEEFPFLYDGATPITQRGKIEVYARAEKPLPSGWVIDQESQPITDSTVALTALGNRTASFLPLGGAGELLAGYKGYGLGTMVEILSASLQTGAFLYGLTGVGPEGQTLPFRIGHFFLAINIEFFVSLAEFKTTTGKILRDLRTSTKAPGQERIFTAGEKEYEMSRLTAVRGIELNANLQKDVKWLQNELGLQDYDFPF
jgi:LDH2 family malate/lactate/ureidoglycolate dehydrogenase